MLVIKEEKSGEEIVSCAHVLIPPLANKTGIYKIKPTNNIGVLPLKPPTEKLTTKTAYMTTTTILKLSKKPSMLLPLVKAAWALAGIVAKE